MRGPEKSALDETGFPKFAAAHEESGESNRVGGLDRGSGWWRAETAITVSHSIVAASVASELPFCGEKRSGLTGPQRPGRVARQQLEIAHNLAPTMPRHHVENRPAIAGCTPGDRNTIPRLANNPARGRVQLNGQGHVSVAECLSSSGNLGEWKSGGKSRASVMSGQGAL
jgi:hypothetical protein